MSDATPINLKDAVAYWTEPLEEEELSEEQQLANFLDALSDGEQFAHKAGAGAEGEPQKVGRRNAARLRLSLPARFVSVERTHQCILLNLSRSGAKIAILESVQEGESGILHCGGLEVFAVIVRSEFSLNGLQFEEEISDDQVLEMRHYHESFEERERRQLIETARNWVTGDSDDERAM
ncbi:MAG: PilZ domain-containing protein [Pseudomonadota bacterium]